MYAETFLNILLCISVLIEFFNSLEFYDLEMPICSQLESLEVHIKEHFNLVRLPSISSSTTFYFHEFSEFRNIF